ncbi:hypothetical protein UlMin_002049, partial [Ulmus minor]
LLIRKMSSGVGSNKFSGTLPPKRGSLVKLKQLFIDNCGIGGEIASTFSELRNMKIVNMQGNSFEGPIPSPFSQLTSLLSL